MGVKVELDPSLTEIEVTVRAPGPSAELTALLARVFRPEDVKDAAKFLIEIMPLMFIPAAVGLLESWGTLSPILIPVLVTTAVSTVLVMGVSGAVTQIIIRRERRKEK